MVKRILSLGMLLFLATSLVTANQQKQTNEDKTVIINNRIQTNIKKYFSQTTNYKSGLIETSDIKKVVDVTPTPYVIREEEIVSIFTSDFKIEERHIKHKVINKEKTKEYIFSVTEKEREILEKITEAECTDQNIDSKKNVISVIFNRINDDSFPDNVKEVVFQKNQFSPTHDGRYYSVTVTQETKDAVEAVLTDGVINEALFFCNINDVKSLKNQKWFKKLTYLFTDDSNHSFYK